jgi:dienelactone hydrolase
MIHYRNGIFAALLLGGICLGSSAQDSAPSWEKLSAAYKYESKALTVKEEVKEDSAHLLQRVSFSNARGESVPGLFRRPKAEGVYPCVLLLHGLTSKKEDMSGMFGRALADKGIASLALDAPNHGERRNGQSPGQDPGWFFNVMRGGITEYRLALDYLKTRKDVDSARMGLVGYSMGAMMGSILSGVDDRVKATVLCVGGDVTKAFADRIPPAAREAASLVAPANFVGHISPRPVLMINGKQDNIVNAAAARALHDAAKDPKEIIWAEATHFLPPAVIVKGIDWLVTKLGKK